jgi:NADH-quinone oxidoreductase subunit C
MNYLLFGKKCRDPSMTEPLQTDSSTPDSPTSGLRTSEWLKAAYPGLISSEFRDERRVVASVEVLYDVLTTLKEEYDFDLLVDVTCVDYLSYRDAVDRFGLVYLLANTETNERMTVRCFVNDPDPTVPSVTPLWEGANWLEREVWDLFGIRFTGHPDLRRIVLPEEFTAHPLRKDYPLQGRGERHNFPVLTRAQQGEEETA